MMRRAVLSVALGAVALSSVHLYRETGYAVLASQSIARAVERSGAAVPGAVLVFQTEDCFGPGDILQQWDEIHSEGRVPVVGLVLGRGELSPLQQRIFAERGLRLPVRGIDPRVASLVGERLGHTRTPFAIILDESGRVTASFPGHTDIDSDLLERLMNAG